MECRRVPLSVIDTCQFTDVACVVLNCQWSVERLLYLMLKLSRKWHRAQAQDQKESRVAYPHKHVPNILVSLIDSYLQVCIYRYSRIYITTCL